ncbi:MAG: hypothetical protein ACREQV_19925, partial [Candidatus Binatia bacterium]
LYRLFNPATLRTLPHRSYGHPDWSLVLDQSKGVLSALLYHECLWEILDLIARKEFDRLLDDNLYERLGNQLPARVGTANLLKLNLYRTADYGRACAHWWRRRKPGTDIPHKPAHSTSSLRRNPIAH